MGRKIISETKQLDIKSIVIDEDLYPRENWNWQTSYTYAQAMMAGAQFPPILVALIKGRYYLVDGRHRIEAVKILKKIEILTEVVIDWTRQRIYEEAIMRNIKHGKALTIHERRIAALRLRQLKYKSADISKLIQVPLDKLNNFIAQRLTNAITGETIAEGGREIAETIPMIVKSGIRNATGMNSVTVETLDITHPGVYSGSQASLLKQLLSIIKSGLLDRENKEINRLIKKLRKVL